ncbi:MULTISPECIES: hypothetical protein [unclassified Nonomuraea]|nr:MULTISPECIES: hypothetical protein [unclassified Nonomuraea]
MCVPRYAAVAAHLGKELDRLQGCKGAACGRDVPEPPAPAR